MSPRVAQWKHSVQWLEGEFIFFSMEAFSQLSYKGIEYSGQWDSWVDSKDNYLCQMHNP